MADISKIWVWNIETRSFEDSLEAHENRIKLLDYSVIANRIISIDYSKIIKIWDSRLSKDPTFI